MTPPVPPPPRGALAALRARLAPRALLAQLSLLSLLVLIPPLAACDDAVAPVRERQIFVEVDPDDLPISGAFAPAGAEAQGGGAQELPSARVLVPAGDTDKTVPIRGEVELGVLLFNQEGDMVSGEAVEFEILDDAGEATLTAARTVTDASGYARVTFYAGPDVRPYRVGARHAQARRAVEFSVSAEDLPAGDLSVRFDYQGPVALDQVEVYLVSQPTWCDSPYYLSPPDDVVLSQNGLALNDAFLARGLLAGSRYAVVVRARTQALGVLAAAGCTGDIRINEDETRSVTVSLLLLPLDPSGRYDILNHYDFTDAIPGSVGQVVEGLVRFFGDANHEREIGGLIFDAVEALAREAAGSIGGLVIDLIRNWVEDDLNRLINEYIDNDGPDWMRDFFTIGSDLISVVSNMEVISDMTLSKARSDGTFEGSQSWIGLAFYWRLGCQGSPDPACGRHPFTMNDLVEGGNNINLVFGQFTGRLHSYNQGVINLHTMDLQYGRLVMFLLNNLLLPRVANGATSLSQALLNLANCPSFANRLTGGRDYLRLGGINVVRRSTIEGWCTTAMSAAGSAAGLIIGGLEVDTRMDLQGEMVFVEETDDLTVDKVAEGRWWGAIRTAQETAPPFSGDFAGERQPRAVNP
ncbi:MAG: hypothetical protein FJ138_09740 [Deltaproteobacteria bacterium]|nr:hypothetical protein [Deltaproteobacteria bacterium]